MKNRTCVLTLLIAASILVFGACDTGRTTSNESGKIAETQQDGEQKENADTANDKSANETEEDDENDAAVEKKSAAGKDEKAFIPAGWKQEDRVAGDLNGDSRPDVVLQIVKENTDTDFNRRMIVLLGTGDGKYTQAGEGRKVIRCTACGGTLGSGPADIKIDKGVIVVSQLYGSRWATDYLHRFRYDKATNRFLLIGEDIRNFDRGKGEAEITSTNYLTGKQIVTKENVDDKGDYVEVGKEEKKVSRTKKYLEDVNYEDY